MQLEISGNQFSLTPGPGENMFKITPSGDAVNGASAADTMLGLSSGSVAGLLNIGDGHVTDFAIVQKSFTLDAGTYSFAWAYAANDYFPYNDGVMFAVVGSGGQSITSLARNGTSVYDLSGPSPGTLILGSYGTTSWKTATFDVVTGGTYLVSIAAYNCNDTSVEPVFYIAAGTGSYTGTEVVTSGGAAVPEPATYVALAGLSALVASLVAAGFRRFRAKKA